MTFTRTFARPRLLATALGVAVLPLLLAGCTAPESDVGERIMSSTATVPAATEPAEATPEEPPTTPVDGAVALEFRDIAFSIHSIESPAGESLTVNIDNVGALEHDFTIEEGTFSDISAEGGTDGSGADYPLHLSLPTGDSGSITFTPGEAGDYVFFCSVPGHRQAGMEGTLHVQ